MNTNFRNIIFLDIDGVMISNNNIKDYYLAHGKKGCPSAIPFDEEALVLLAILVGATNAKIVLSSTWRVVEQDIDFFKEQLKIYNIEDSYIGNTKYFGRREDEIESWIKEHEKNGERFNVLVIDDDSFDLKKYEDRLVQTDVEKGFVREDFFKSMKILGRKANE